MKDFSFCVQPWRPFWRLLQSNVFISFNGKVEATMCPTLSMEGQSACLWQSCHNVEGYATVVRSHEESEVWALINKDHPTNTQDISTRTTDSIIRESLLSKPSYSSMIWCLQFYRRTPYWYEQIPTSKTSYTLSPKLSLSSETKKKVLSTIHCIGYYWFCPNHPFLL